MNMLKKRLSDLHEAYKKDGVKGAVLITIIYVDEYYLKPIFYRFSRNRNNPWAKSNFNHELENMVPSNQYLQDFGFCILGPLIYTLFQQLYGLKNKDDPPIVFLSREGFYLNKLYKYYLMKKNHDQKYFYIFASRPYLFRCLLGYPEHIGLSTSHHFRGMVSEFLKTRFLLTSHEIMNLKYKNCRISMPHDREIIHDIYKRNENYLVNIGRLEKNKYEGYLEQSGIFAYKKCVIADIGYNGTTQDVLNVIFNDKILFSGHYIFSTSNDKTKTGAWSEGVGFNEGSSLIDNSILLEAILTADHGQFTGLFKTSDQYKPLFNVHGKTQRLFYLTEKIIEGVKEFLAIDENRFNDNKQYYNDTLDSLYLSRKSSNVQFNILRQLLDVDDEISGEISDEISEFNIKN